ncbi:MAG: hypothetical protein D6811_04320 [Alphaproteobacteria bacterium]|nr:MAG: hypothetical protein D6811_04320 [Alphaproteobacteria bacterium]
MTGTGSAINVSVGFTPARVEIINETDPGHYIWTDTMGAGEMLKLVDGTVALTFASSGGISTYAGSSGSAAKGFTIGADADMNGSGDTLHWVAWPAD